MAADGNEGIVYILYRNHRYVTSWRRVKPASIYFGANQWHPEPQWLLRADDLDKGDLRDFAMKDILAWSTTPPNTSTSRPGRLVELSLDGEQEPTT